MISQTSSYPDCESTCPKVAELQGKIEALKEENADLRREKQEAEKKLNYQKEKYARLWEKHENFYQEALDAVEGGGDLEEVDWYVCPVCGNTFEGDAPEKCPICGASREQFEEVE